MKELVKDISKERIIQSIYQLSQIENEMKWSTQRTILFQVGIMKLAMKQEQKDFVSLQTRIQELEEKIEKLQQGTTILQPSEKYAENRVEKPTPERKKEEKNTPKKENNLQGAGLWSNVINQLKTSGKVMLYTNLMNSKATQINDMVIGIEFPNGLTSFGKTILEKSENMNELKRLVSIEYGKEMQIKLIDPKQEAQKPKEKEDFSKEIDIPIHIVDE